MKNIFEQLIRNFTLVSIIVFALFFILGVLGLRFNVTNSVPKGFYWQLNKPLFNKGEYIIFCPLQNHLFNLGKERGYISSGTCTGNYKPMIKRVAGVKGDNVKIDEEGVWINGEFWINSKPQQADKFNRPIPRLNPASFTLKSSNTLLMGETLTSFDSRYFGPIPNTQIEGVLIPLLTW